MDIIHLLPDSVANQIAAGEVVQRPSSVIKELMENSIDAGATHVDVVVLDAGKTSIRVSDDGKGMSQTDARMAFERHATSKIRQADDLFTLHTMGFRGEALPSIAAVAQVALTTRTCDSELGVRLSIEGSRVVSQEACSCPAGAHFEVSNLFFNVPARRKFLKSNHTELNNIIQEFERVALVNPSVSFSLTSDGSEVCRLQAGPMRQRISSLFGKRMGEQLLPLEVSTTLARVSGFVGKPEAARRKQTSQYLFVNGRYMRHPYFHRAVMESYAHLVPEGEQVPYFLYFEVDPADIDVNIHPTKTEIKFENDAAIWQILVAATRDTLGRFAAVPVIDFDVEGKPDIPALDPSRLSGARPPRVDVDVEYNPFRPKQPSSRAAGWERLYEGLGPGGSPAPDIPDGDGAEQPALFSTAGGDGMEASSEHFQMRGQYILTPVRSGLMIVDQRKAHIRVLYDRFLARMDGQASPAQGLLFPQTLRLPPSDAARLEGMAADLRALGFDVTPLGGGDFSIGGVPAELCGADAVKVLTSMVESAGEGETPGRPGNLRHKLALVMAQSAAIVVGQALTAAEMDALLGDLFRSEAPGLTPSGQTVVAILPQADIDKMFN